MDPDDIRLIIETKQQRESLMTTFTIENLEDVRNIAGAFPVNKKAMVKDLLTKGVHVIIEDSLEVRLGE